MVANYLENSNKWEQNSIKLPNYHNTKNKLKEKNVADYQIALEIKKIRTTK